VLKKFRQRVCVDVVQKARQDHGKVVELQHAVVIHVGQIDDIRDEIAQLAHLNRNRSLGDRLVSQPGRPLSIEFPLNKKQLPIDLSRFRIRIGIREFVLWQRRNILSRVARHIEKVQDGIELHSIKFLFSISKMQKRNTKK
jgi:hypothetical protein